MQQEVASRVIRSDHLSPIDNRRRQANLTLWPLHSLFWWMPLK